MSICQWAVYAYSYCKCAWCPAYINNSSAGNAPASRQFSPCTMLCGLLPQATDYNANVNVSGIPLFCDSPANNASGFNLPNVNGAQVYLNNNYVGTTPYTGPSNRYYSIRVTAPVIRKLLHQQSVKGGFTPHVAASMATVNLNLTRFTAIR